jgi:predicted NBD/HSP70 family sugar kinase
VHARLAEEGYQVATAADVVALGQSTDPRVTDILREAGTHIGEVLSAIVNFMNPRDVVLAGSMSAVAPLVAAIRAQLFQRCLPLVTEHLEVRASRSPGDAAIRGATQLILEEVYAPARVESLARALTGDPSQARA